MRKIKFRGKRIDNGEWVVGSLINKIKPTEIEDVFWASLIHDGALTAVEVNPETVGQFTGLHDKNGVEVWEGDIVSSDWLINEEKIIFNCTGEVKYSNKNYCYEIRGVNTFMPFSSDESTLKSIEIIGNVFDKPELL